MISEKMQEALNGQINWEMFSGYLYLSMSAYFDDLGLPGMAAWMKNQSGEEMFHAMKMYDYLCERGGRVELRAIDAPRGEWGSPLEAFEEALEHEQGVTARINAMMNLAVEEKDHAAGAFLQWFIEEQVEEEASVGDAVSKLKLVGDGGGLYMLDRELGKRVFTWPGTVPDPALAAK